MFTLNNIDHNIHKLINITEQNLTTALIIKILLPIFLQFIKLDIKFKHNLTTRLPRQKTFVNPTLRQKMTNVTTDMYFL